MAKFLVLIFCTLVSEWQYINTTLATCVPDCTTRLASIANGTESAPFAYRILTPKIVMALGGDIYALALFHLIGLFIFFALLYKWVSLWTQQGTLAITLATVALSVMYPTWYFSEYMLTEWILFLSALLVLSSWRRSTAKPTRF
jgi:hypothetical protein